MTTSSSTTGPRKRAAAKAGSRRRSRPSPRERLLASATQLFTTEGIRVIGIDRILREADVAKASLYSLFGSKDALVMAYVQRLDEQWREAWAQRVAGLHAPEEKILAFFDQCIEELPAQNYRGSHFQNADSEYPKPETDAEQGIVDAVMAHRRWCQDTLTALLNEKNGYPSATQAAQLLIFLDGGIAGSRLMRDTAPLVTARDLARQVLSTPPADYSI
ncbi:TetR/AcrR family transcriptional regulator [Corynebacterium uberis]|uniref:TetR/AcrR family transcriptional regulator n=1 Tax=Corynebacterium TaxID=1716 RepID=UPI001D0ACF04|nr:TetR/AcrR family transcriptional regulator [Corynebacterium uberis]MCZ9309561.1 TetR/AcrR family transcriptional regulator [Corynebacterium sp. c6VSa_13]UDL73375.1 TetR/AcrR family transcriptional regulator [Corynebacterium uberis]UDL77958.1 TetR/AcrR family transcriptional regulator [Corynebacterium uberis]UDL80242.1 TetR/AcrR family transcriptional regulator [Corynebacterium uberis]UDL82376.1 TetR/AcrR family transcriptional regulator [Corynebacterium uberis]